MDVKNPGKQTEILSETQKNPFDETDFDFLAISEQKSQKLGLEFEFK